MPDRAASKQATDARGAWPTSATRRVSALLLAAGLGIAALPARAQSPVPTAPATPTAPAAAGTTAATPGAGFADPRLPPPRAPAPDIEPVWRAPAVDTLATVRRRGVLRVGVAVNEPMVMHDRRSGALVGYGVDLATRLAEDLGVRLELVETAWSSIVGDLLDRQYDIALGGLWVTVPRALVINFSAPTAVEGVYVFTTKAAAGRWRSPADLDRSGTRLVVAAGTSQEQVAARRFPKATLVRIAGDEDAFALLADGRAQAALVPTFAPGVIVAASGDRLALAFDRPLASASTAIGLRKGDPDWQNFLDTWLGVRRDEGWLEERAQHWSTQTDWMR